MALNNLPSALQSVIQQGYLERQFHDALKARLGFRAIADREAFPAQIGETITKTRRGLLPAATTPVATQGGSNTDFSSGLTAKNYGVEQYILSVAQYADMMMLNIATSRVAIVPMFMQNVAAQGEQAARTVDTLAQQALFNAYMGGNTRVTTTLGANGATISVDDIRGFQQTLNSSGQPVPVSTTNKVIVTVNGTAHNLQAATADGSNVSTAPGGVSGTLTFDANVVIADGTAGNAVVSSVAPFIMRPSNSSTGVMAPSTTAIATASDFNAAQLTAQMILNAAAQLRTNNVPPGADGRYVCYADPVHLTGVYNDQAFQRFFTGKPETSEYRSGIIGDLLGVRIQETNLNPVQFAVNGTGGFSFTAPVRRAIVVGQGALIEGTFTSEGYAAVNAVDSNPLVTVVDGIAHITREPMDALQQIVTTSWAYIGGFVAPTDTTANPTVLPSATNAALKRAVIIESL
jgi:hypothetical protein